MELEWWHWAVAGMALILAELAIPAFVLIWFGAGALVVALVTLILPAFALTAQLTLWLLVSISLVFGWFKIFRPNQHKTHVGMSAANLVGEVGLLTRDVAPFQKGEVRFQKPIVGSDVWACLADVPLSAGTRVKIVAIEGSFVRVEKS